MVNYSAAPETSLNPYNTEYHSNKINQYHHKVINFNSKFIKYNMGNSGAWTIAWVVLMGSLRMVPITLGVARITRRPRRRPNDRTLEALDRRERTTEERMLVASRERC